MISASIAIASWFRGPPRSLRNRYPATSSRRACTDADKPFLETAPWLVAVFYRAYDMDADGQRRKVYYPIDSTGIATGFLIAALHHAGLACLTHTPSPMRFLNEILGRPANERPFLLLVVGYPAAGATVPDIARKPLEAITEFR